MTPSSRQSRKKVVVVLNGISLKKKYFYHHVFPQLSRHCDIEVFETLSKNDGITLASKAAEKYPDVVFAAGGDGTLNQVVNGILRGRETGILPVIGVIPIGTGNDFARTVGVTADYRQLTSLLESFQPRKIDVGQVKFTRSAASAAGDPTNERYFVNVADIGMGPVVVEKVLKSGRPFGHAAAYYLSILSTFVSYKPVFAKVTTRDWQWQGKLRSLAVGNGKYYGHGLGIAPDAILDDRKFQVFICGNVSVLDFILQTGTLKKGKHIHLSEVLYKDATEIELTSEMSCMIEGDGEILGVLPASVRLIERQLDFLIP
jgi:diacylglycerol kinase (ATP)